MYLNKNTALDRAGTCFFTTSFLDTNNSCIKISHRLASREAIKNSKLNTNPNIKPNTNMKWKRKIEQNGKQNSEQYNKHNSEENSHFLFVYK